MGLLWCKQLASIMASATPFCFCTTQKHLTFRRTKCSRNLGYYDKWPKVAGALIKAKQLTP
jgi:hypothetical protein